MKLFNNAIFFNPGSDSNLLFISMAYSGKLDFNTCLTCSNSSIPMPPLKKNGFVEG